MIRLTSQGFVKTSSNLPLAKVFTVTKNEYDLIEDFIRYHGDIFGYDNIVVLDNESDDPRVLDIYKEYAPKGVTVRYVSGYTGDMQGHHFTQAMKEHATTAEFLIGLDTDCFFTVNEKCDRDTICTYLQSLPKHCDIFTMQKFLLSVVDTSSDNYVDNMLVRPTSCTSFVLRSGYAGIGLVRHVFFRGHAFVSTQNGNHGGVSMTNTYHNCPEIAYVHYHDTGKRRHLERCKAILIAYGFIRSNMTDAEQLHALRHNPNGSGTHRQWQYMDYLRDPSSFFKEDPIPNDMVEFVGVKNALLSK